MEKRALALVGFVGLVFLEEVAVALCDPILETCEPTMNQRLEAELEANR